MIVIPTKNNTQRAILNNDVFAINEEFLNERKCKIILFCVIKCF